MSDLVVHTLSRRETKPMMLYDLEIEVEELDDGSGYRYMATSPDLPNLIVAGDTPEEVLALVPQVAAALITSMKAAGNIIVQRRLGRNC